MARQQSETETVSAGSPSVTITGTFVTPYVAGLTVGWNTTVWVDPSGKSASGFTAYFGTPPTEDLNVDWGTLEDV